MKLILILLLLFAATGYSQEKAITYKSHVKKGYLFGSTLTLRNNCTFNYHLSGDLFMDNANGSYNIFMDTIHLQFIDTLKSSQPTDSIIQHAPVAGSEFRPLKLFAKGNKLFLIYDGKVNKSDYFLLNGKRYFKLHDERCR